MSILCIFKHKWSGWRTTSGSSYTYHPAQVTRRCKRRGCGVFEDRTAS